MDKQQFSKFYDEKIAVLALQSGHSLTDVVNAKAVTMHKMYGKDVISDADVSNWITELSATTIMK